MKRNDTFLPVDSNEIFGYWLPAHVVNFYIKFCLYKNVSSKLYTNPALFIDVCTASSCDLVSKPMCSNQSPRKKINFRGRNKINVIRVIYVDLFVMLRLCNAVRNIFS